ncbi:MAG: methylmalonyl Co-A mutase-associated GTPase MeaB [Proteobacteria bacterium]|nr:methylmalonyl Co-A mutase-associated GTPase MeaB [Pseudomonadota bacterium]MBU1585668.1 methylmalonyl Co-A mutase-associated GTPase MeaB [Pseudomonadota bacterium]MBU2455224.1 methylmalonyl Co-A mutase-associated GTPase MeaB [Pseudomonadota bacterium]MBU2628532.1 methylmalonyl Co-A mutase-associated GTPase MeaB [Pseudomonadota bacterium]
MLNAKDILAGDQRAGAQVIRLIEDHDPAAFELLKELYPHSGTAFIIGITGSPGVGKSTLIDALITEFRNLDKKVAVIAVDPSSPVSGGAILGDRLRMQRHAADEKVFIRSMASRGQKGGLSRATHDAVIVLDAMGYEMIIIETVGAGQAEFDIASLAHSTGIVSIPGAGDGIQAIKAGILETGDIFIVNKSERPGADACAGELEMMLGMRPPSSTGWAPRVLKTCAIDGTGVKDLAKVFLSHFDFMKKSGRLDVKKKETEHLYFQSLLTQLALEKIMQFIHRSPEFKQALNNIESRSMDPISAAQKVVNCLCGLDTQDYKDRR